MHFTVYKTLVCFFGTTYIVISLACSYIINSVLHDIYTVTVLKHVSHYWIDVYLIGRIRSFLPIEHF